MPSQDELHYEPDDIMLGVDMRQCQHLARAFDLMAERIGPVTNTTVLWTLASLVAKILAESAMDPGLMHATGQRFSDMLRAAYPAMVKVYEENMRAADGRPAYDA